MSIPSGNSRDRRCVVVGLGGIGSWLVQGLAPFLNFSNDTWTLVLIDGDEYEDKNRTRQAFDDLGPKAEVQAGWIAKRFPRIAVQPLPEFLSADGAEGTLPAKDAICSGDFVFLALDNHKSRKMIFDHCYKLRDVVLVSGGNDYEDGNVQVFVRSGGEDKTCRPDKHHPELAAPQDKAPWELSCEELAASSPQLIFANMSAATLMLGAFYALEQKRLDFAKPEVYFDIVKMTSSLRERR
ncbi:hypothetical protein A3H16_04085 [Candidatus Kaiserbacteria bacterium RIFCSPLOWO2_12_FULL_53_8]|uniref:THIF-type NAD/FAD binding fold domain-containing protein n=2 Tax=Candidatus Kaiseribacteriota TaxID=1752734 RepID=A0A1F6CTG4_9BACT|nr:MAG: hypothetical protein A2851_05535 [Candidatus Kaiserbacteria bacterium RIFCSPHIGHO2_01_FULL_53_29]OGG92398.1 MAG: hypothetical protein A3H16_04085 [Candidatus Kaiserbacteria bacterium RIFCSPLOWO2_12_FULL_53_8]